MYNKASKIATEFIDDEEIIASIEAAKKRRTT